MAEDGSVDAAAEEPAAAGEPFVMRSRLVAEDAETLPPASIPAAAAAAQPWAIVQPSDELAAVQPAAEALQASATSAALPAEPEQLQQQQTEDETAAAFAVKPRLSMSPALPAERRHSGVGSHAAAPEAVDAAAAFAAKPKLAQSPAVSSGSVGGRASFGRAAAAPGPELPPAVPFVPSPQQQTAAPEAEVQRVHQPDPAPAPAMSSNPLAAGATPGAAPAVSSRRLSQSPALRCTDAMCLHPACSVNITESIAFVVLTLLLLLLLSSPCSGASAGSVVSTNPLYAGGTPAAHPTPPSVTLKSFSGRVHGIAGGSVCAL